MKTCPNKTRLILIVITFLALLLRAIVFIKNINDISLTGDALNYMNMAIQLVKKGIYGYGSSVSNAYVTPGYPLFLSSIYYVFNDLKLSILIARFLQLLIGGMTPVLMYLVTYKFLKRKDVGLLTALIAAIYPTYVKSTTFLLTEVLALAMMMIYFYVYLEAFEKRSPYLYVLSGFAFAAEILIRPTMLPLFILPFIFTLISRKMGTSETVRAFLYSCIGLIFIMLPWWIRNWTTLHQFILLSTSAGDPLLAGTYPFMKDTFKDVDPKMLASSQFESSYAIQRIKNGFQTQPLLYLYWFTIGKTKNMFIHPWLYGEKFQNLIFYFHRAIALGGLFGLVINSIINKKFIMVSIYALTFLGLYLMFIPEQRYTYQLLYFCMLSVSYLICLICDKINLQDFIKTIFFKVKSHTL